MKMFFAALTASALLFSASPGACATGAEDSALRSCAEDAQLCLAERDAPWCMATCLTLRNNVRRALNGMHFPEDVGQAVRNMAQDWESWRNSPLFRLKSAGDMEAFGSVYALRTLCTTLRFAAEEWLEKVPGEAQEALVETARWLEEECLQMEAPMEQILRRQSYDAGIVRRLDLMQALFTHARHFYASSTERRRIFAPINENRNQKEARQ